MKALNRGRWSHDRRAIAAVLFSLFAPFAVAQNGPISRVGASTPIQVGSTLEVAKFTDVVSQLGLSFAYVASHTSKKYFIETMRSGVALLDYDSDGRLDIFVMNRARLDDPTPKGTIPQKTGPRDWNRLYHKKSDGTFEDVMVKAGLQGVGYGMGVAVGDYDDGSGRQSLAVLLRRC
jgi:FG-GAP-like repeat